MVATGLIIFREVLEIALVVSVLMAATRGLARRKRWVWGGVTLGIAGAAVVAFFAELISNAAEGMGQELFNATVLLLAALLIGWTVVWMRLHGKELMQRFKACGDSVVRGESSMITLTLVVALAMLREGSEIVLFTYGILASGGTFLEVLIGSAVGLGLGVAVGVLLYFGLIKISPRRMFAVTSWMLILLAAGMVSQAVGLLQAGGFFPEYIPMLWDSSRFLSEQSMLGSVLHVLVGYTARPSLAQVVSFCSVLVFLIATLRIMEGNKVVRIEKKVGLAVVFLGFSLIVGAPSAFAAKKVYSPIVEGGELEIEVRGSYDFDSDNSKDGKQKQKYAVGYGVNNWWFTEIYTEFERGASDSNFDFTSVEFENRFQLTEQGQYPVDIGLYFAYELSVEENHGDKVELKLLTEKSLDKFTHTANFILEKQVGGDAREETEAGIAWATRYRWQPYLEPGFEIHSGFGELNERLAFDAQSHLIGPVFYGKVGAFKYDVGYLFGVSRGAPDGMLKWIFEYEFPVN